MDMRNQCLGRWRNCDNRKVEFSWALPRLIGRWSWRQAAPFTLVWFAFIQHDVFNSRCGLGFLLLFPLIPLSFIPLSFVLIPLPFILLCFILLTFTFAFVLSSILLSF